MLFRSNTFYDVLALYLKPTFSDEDSELIENAIDNRDIDTEDIREDCMDYIYQKLEDEGIDDVEDIDIWKYTDENLQNGLTHEENYQNLKNYLKRENLIP